jgi:hypothetical protein
MVSFKHRIELKHAKAVVLAQYWDLIQKVWINKAQEYGDKGMQKILIEISTINIEVKNYVL